MQVMSAFLSRMSVSLSLTWLHCQKTLVELGLICVCVFVFLCLVCLCLSLSSLPHCLLCVSISVLECNCMCLVCMHVVCLCLSLTWQHCLQNPAGASSGLQQEMWKKPRDDNQLWLTTQSTSRWDYKASLWDLYHQITIVWWRLNYSDPQYD